MISPKRESKMRVWKTIREEDQEPCCKHPDGECSGNPTEQSLLALHLSQLHTGFQPKLAPFYKTISTSLKTSTYRNHLLQSQGSVNYIFSADIQAQSNSREVKGFLFSFPVCRKVYCACPATGAGGRLCMLQAHKTIIVIAYGLPSAALILV